VILLLIVLNHKEERDKGFLLWIMIMLWFNKLRGTFVMLRN
jgi:hypothetical protein